MAQRVEARLFTRPGFTIYTSSRHKTDTVSISLADHSLDTDIEGLI